MIVKRNDDRMKQALRNQIAVLQNKMADSDLYYLSSQIFQRLVQIEAFQSAKCVLAYYSFGSEVYTHDFVDELSHYKKVLLPVVTKDALILREYLGREKMSLSRYGILEPTSATFTDYAQIDVGIIPGMVFDRELNRLGRGKAYYDRLLPFLSNTYLMGVCLPFQLKDNIPVEVHDIKMDCIVTSNEIVL